MKRTLLALLFLVGFLSPAYATQKYLPTTYVNNRGCAIPPATPCEIELTQIAITDINTGAGDDFRFVLFNLELFNTVNINPTQAPPLTIQLRATRDGTTIASSVIAPKAGNGNIQIPVFLSGLSTGQHSYQFFVTQNTSGPISYTPGTYALVGALNVATVSSGALTNNSTACTGSAAGHIIYMNGSVINCANGPTYNSGTDTVTATNFAGNATTATALAANPTDCAANQFANAIAANGNLTCAAINPATALTAGADDTMLISNGSNFVNTAIPLCIAAGEALTYDTTTNTVGCHTISGGGGAGYTTIQDEGTNLTQRTTLNFAGAGVSCADGSGKTTCTISGSGAGTVTGTGTTNHLAKWTSSSAIGDSASTDDGTTLTVGGNLSYGQTLALTGKRIVTTDATLNSTDRYVRCVGGSGSGITLTLPAATGTGRVIDVQKVDTGSGICHVSPAGGDTIDTAAGAVLLSFGNNVTLIDAASGSWDAPLGNGGQGAPMLFNWLTSLSSTCYGPGKPDTGCLTADSSQVPMAREGSVHNLFCSLGGALGSGGYQVTMRYDGSDTALTCSITSQQCSDTNDVDAFNVVHGHTVSLKAVPSSPDIATPINCTVLLE